MKRYTEEDEEDDTVAGVLANVLSDILGDLGILLDRVNVTYYEHIENRTVPDSSYNKDKRSDYKSLMWTIPFGTNQLEYTCWLLVC